MASTLLSPGVAILERDLTLGSIETVEINVGAIAGAFSKGPVNTPTRITSESELLNTFGEPNDSNAETWFAASSFLAYGGVLEVVRASGSALKNGTSSGTGVLIENSEVYEGTYYDGAQGWNWGARFSGTTGNSIRVVSIDKGADQTLTLAGAFQSAVSPGDTLNNSAGTKSAVVWSVSGTKVNIINVTGGAWTTSDLADDDSNPDIAVSAVADWYDSQEVYTGLRWNQLAPRPGTSPFVADRGGSDDEIHLAVFDVDGGITGTPLTLLEKFTYLSKASDAKTPEGSLNYYPEVVLNKSNYIYWGKHEAGSGPAGVWDVSANAFTTSAGNLGAESSVASDLIGERTYTFSGGVDAYTLTQGEIISGYDLFSDVETVQLDYLILGGGGATELETIAKANKLIAIAGNRKDCIAYLSPHKGNVVGVSNSATQTENVVDYYSNFASSSYVVFDNGWKYLYDRFADKYRWIPCNGDVAGLCASTTANGDPWFSPAGLNRGGIRNAIKLAYSPKRSERDTLYQNRINPITSLPGQGIVLFGDKTALASPSAFDRINVRRLFLVIEKTLGNAAKGVLFELNDEFTRNNFNNVVEPYLRDIQARRGITDFLVVCDTSNNTGAVIDANEFVAEIYIKPARSINFITLTFVATRTGVSFEEVIPRRS